MAGEGHLDTAVVTITVTPVNDAPLAIDDVFSTNINTPLNADVSLNDSDVENNTLTFSVLSSTINGTIAFNTNGSFTYTPNAGFTGIDTFSYLVCDNGTPALCDTALVTINVNPGIPSPLVGVAKSVSVPIPQGNGIFAVTYSVIIKNYGSVIASNVQVTDNLAATFPSPATFSVVGISSSILFANSPNYNGTTDINLLEPLVNQLAPGASDTITIAILVTPNSAGPFNNSAIASALGSAADSSVNGTNPDPNGDLIPNESSATPLTFPVAVKNQIGISKTASVSTKKEDGSYEVTYTFEIQNMGNTLLTNIVVFDNLGLTFPSPVSFSIISVTTNGGLTANPSYTGTGTNTNLLSSQGSTIAAGITNGIVLKINVNTNGTSGTYLNRAEAVGNGPLGATTKDNSNDGRIDNNLNGNPSDPGEDAPTPVTLDGEITPLVIFIPEGFTPDGDAQNEFFVITGISLYPDNKLTILNRWGNIVYQKTGYDNTWNGISDFGDGKVTQGTYYYVLEFNKDELEPRKGYVVIEY